MTTVEILKRMLKEKESYIANMMEVLEETEEEVLRIRGSIELANQERMDIDDSIMRLEDNS